MSDWKELLRGQSSAVRYIHFNGIYDMTNTLRLDEWDLRQARLPPRRRIGRWFTDGPSAGPDAADPRRSTIRKCQGPRLPGQYPRL